MLGQAVAHVHPWIGLALLPLGFPWLAQQPAFDARERHCFFYEAEKVFTNREQWLSQNWYKPSGGEWLYGNLDRGSPTGEIELPDAGPWFVWLRMWDWDTADRRAVLEVNGEESRPCGGWLSSQWVWCHTHVADGPLLALRVSGVDPMDAWVDCLAVTNDPLWVPPHEMATGGAYSSDGAYELSCRKPALIWPRAAGEEVTEAYYRRTFLVPAGATVARAAMRIGATGYWVAYLNGQDIGFGEGGAEAAAADLGPALREGANALCVELVGGASPTGVWVDGVIETRDGWVLNLCSNPAWRSSLRTEQGWLNPDFDDSDWAGCWALAKEKPF